MNLMQSVTLVVLWDSVTESLLLSLRKFIVIKSSQIMDLWYNAVDEIRVYRILAIGGST